MERSPYYTNPFAGRPPAMPKIIERLTIQVTNIGTAGIVSVP